jgi:hypothetical protein
MFPSSASHSVYSRYSAGAATGPVQRRREKKKSDGNPTCTEEASKVRK